MREWFTVEQVDHDTWAISEYGHWEETHCYLAVGRERALLIDTGLGVQDISAVTEALTGKIVTALPTHVHWDHIGGLWRFEDFLAHRAELPWLTGGFPLPLEAVRNMVARDCRLPENFDLGKYRIFQGTPKELLSGGEILDLGGRKLEVIHTPGHSPGHMCLWERERGYLFTGDLVYRGTLYADYPSTDPEAYLKSLEKTAALPVERVLPGHHSLDVDPGLVSRVRNGLQDLKSRGLLRHGSGTFEFGDWGIRL